jgi:hypothetical protein
MSGQAVADCKGCGAALARGFVEDVGQVMGNGFLAESQFPGNLVVRQPFRHQFSRTKR